MLNLKYIFHAGVTYPLELLALACRLDEESIRGVLSASF